MLPTPSSLVALLAGIALTAAAAAAGDDQPNPYPLSRYQALVDQSPFLRTSTTVPEAPMDSFAKDLSLISIARIDGQYFVGVENRKTKDYFEVGEIGDTLRVLNVHPHDDPLQVKVELASGSEVATIGFDPDQIRAPGIQPPKAPTRRKIVRPSRPAPPKTASAPAVPAAKPAAPLKQPTLRRRILLPRNPGTQRGA